MSRAGRGRAPVGALLLLASGLGACEPVPQPQFPPLAGAGGDGGGIDTRALQPSGCQAEGFPSVSGVFAARLETAAVLSGPGLDGQIERVTRYALVELCQQGAAVIGVWLTCGGAVSPVLDGTDTCAAQAPSAALWASLPAVLIEGQVDLTAPEPVLALGWGESWGLAEGARLPREPSGAAVAELEGVVDQDADGHPGVTLAGDGPVPTLSWAARTTAARLDLVGDLEARLLVGVSTAETAEVILGGPASRVLRGRRRANAQGQVTLVRISGPAGQIPLDQDRDGRLTCAELAALYGDPLAAPRPGACKP